MDVRDAASGLILGMERGKVGERYIVGGENVTFEQLFGLLTWITRRPGPRIKVLPAAARVAGRVAQRLLKEPPLTEQGALMMERRWYYDDAKARRELGHASRPLEETLRDAIAWFEARGLN
jgi:dihydroflavonol-4-reductase